VAVLFAISLVVLVFAGGLALDGGFGLFQYRQAQNAADFAAEGGAQALSSNCDGGTVPAPISGGQLVEVIDDLVNHNSPNSAVPATDTTKNWSAIYLNSSSQPFDISPGDDTVSASTGIIPAGACGVHVTVDPEWPPFIAQIMGFTHLETAAGAAAVNNVGYQGEATSIVALAENGAHTILEAGNGTFNVIGTTFDNANGFLNTEDATWNSSDCDPTACSDTIDGKQNGKMNIQGDLDAAAVVPFDWCFGGDTPPNANLVLPAVNTATCSANNTTITYSKWYGNQGQRTTDPIQTSDTAPPPPTADDAVCPGFTTPTTYTSNPTSGVFSPGVYNYTVVITGNAQFQNCSQVLGQPDTGTVYEGLYDFPDGLVIMPGAGDSVTGNGVTFYTQNVPSTIDGIQNVGDGEPVLPAAVNSTSCSSGSDNCNPDQSASSTCTTCEEANPVGAQGLDDSVEIGGTGTVNLSAPDSGTYDDFLIWQDSSIEANIGLDTLPTDSASITLGGIIYDNSDQQGQILGNETYWGNGSGIPFLPGGMLVAGFGVDSTTGMTCSSSTPCDVTINGLADVDVFQTQGNTDLNINGTGYEIPGIAGSGATLVG
jgi:hypothetical protein